MKFTPKKSGEDKDSMSIVWSDKHMAYTFGNSKTIGVATFNGYEENLQARTHGMTDELKAEITAAGFPVEHVDLNTYRFNNGRFSANDIFDCEVLLEKPVNELPYGVFTMATTSHGDTLFKPYKKQVESLVLIKNKSLKADVTEFFANKTETGRKNKMGMLLYGPPGNGKTTEIMSLFDVCEELKLRIFVINSGFSTTSMEDARDILNGQNCIFVLEEVTERLSRRGLEEILTFLDGETSWTNSITIATTNYPEDLPSNLVDRPGRFERFIEYGNPSKDEVIQLANSFGFYQTAPEGKVVQPQYLFGTELFGQGLSFDYVSFILSSAKKTGLTLKETINNEEQKRKRLSSTFKGKIGL